MMGGPPVPQRHPEQSLMDWMLRHLRRRKVAVRSLDTELLSPEITAGVGCPDSPQHLHEAVGASCSILGSAPVSPAQMNPRDEHAMWP